MNLLPPTGIGDFRITENYFSLGASPVTVASPNPTRVAIIFSASPAFAQVSTNSKVGSNQGLLLSTTVPILQLMWHDLGALLNQAWYGFAGGATTLTVIEVFYQPQGR